jgi:hypothetical protein
MKRILVVAVAVGLACCSISNASITNVNYASDGDGVFACTPWSFDTNATELTLPMIYGDYGTNSPAVGTPGHLILNVLTTSPEDPTLKISNSIENDSTFAWTQFTVNLYMAVQFTVTNTTLSGPAGWSLAGPSTQTATFNGTQWEATVLYQGSPAIQNDNVSTIDFGYWVKFNGQPSYAITQEMIPVPEPATYAMVALGAIALLGSRRLRRRS